MYISTCLRPSRRHAFPTDWRPSSLEFLEGPHFSSPLGTFWGPPGCLFGSPGSLRLPWAAFGFPWAPLGFLFDCPSVPLGLHLVSLRFLWWHGGRHGGGMGVVIGVLVDSILDLVGIIWTQFWYNLENHL